MKVLGLIPARGGSKGVPGKNIRVIGDKPLLAYTAESALLAKNLTRVILSTDDQKIADIGTDCGLDVPFIRPSELAEDGSPTLPVIRHALDWLGDKNEIFDAVCLLQPTNPLRKAEDIDRCVELLDSSGADSVITVLPIPADFNPHWAYRRTNTGTLELFTGESDPISRRQDLPLAFHRDGTVYVTRTKTIIDNNSLYGEKVIGYEVDPKFSINIDTEEDWKEAVHRVSR